MAREHSPVGRKKEKRWSELWCNWCFLLTIVLRTSHWLRILESNFALSSLLKGTFLPGTDAVGKWLPRTWVPEGLTDLSRENQRIIATRIWQARITPYTTENWRSTDHCRNEGTWFFTYKGEQAAYRWFDTLLRQIWWFMRSFVRKHRSIRRQ